VTASTHGVVFTTVPTDDGGLATSRGSADFTMRLTADDVLEVERDAGVRETLHRIEPGAQTARRSAGRYGNPDTAATWTIAPGETGIALHVAGPLARRRPWEIEPVEGDSSA